MKQQLHPTTQPHSIRQRIRQVATRRSLTAVLAAGAGTTLMVWLGFLPIRAMTRSARPASPAGAWAATTAGSRSPGAVRPKPDDWHPPGDDQLPTGAAGKQIRYGRELIAHTALYLGPAGSVRHISNGMNCQNCHLDAGTKVLGNNYSAVFSTYPKFRDRSGSIETVVKRITDCFERSLGGSAPDSNSREMKAIVAYMQWLGTGVPTGKKPDGAGLTKLPYPNRAADPATGRFVYAAKCQHCHGSPGEGVRVPGSAQYTYPPLWGANSYNDGAGLYRLSSFAGYVKNNMPFGASYQNPQLTDAESWDVAAFINSMPRPHKDQSRDWPNISTKPIDHPFPPYADQFSEHQHKFGPFQPIADAKKRRAAP